MDDGFTDLKKKAHNKPRAGRKADKKKPAPTLPANASAKQRNPKAFAIQRVHKAEKRVRRKEDITEKRARVPVVGKHRSVDN